MQDQRRVLIDYVYPKINDGDLYIKRVVHERVTVDAHVLVDGHDVIAASVLYKHEREKKWQEVRMHAGMNNEWHASFTVVKQGFYTYKVEGWVDYALNWQHGIQRKIEDNQIVKSELLEGILFLKSLSEKAHDNEKEYLKHLQHIFGSEPDYDEAIKAATSKKLHDIFTKHPQKILANTSKDYRVYVDRLKARFSTWYEFFPRSASEQKGVHGTLKTTPPRHMKVMWVQPGASVQNMVVTQIFIRN